MRSVLIALVLSCALVSSASAQHWHGNAGHGWGGGFGYHGGWDYRGSDGVGSGFLGGIIGGAIGSIFAPAPVIVEQAPVIVQPAPALVPWSPQWYTYCAQRYRTFDAHSGMFIGFDGKPYFCQ